MSELFQEMCKLLQIRRINSTAFNPQMQGKVEKFHLGLNQTMSHYVNKYGSDWDEFVNYALMAHRAIPHSITRYSPFYLMHGRQMRLPMEDDLTTARFLNKEPIDNRNPIQDHIDTLADRLEEAYRVTRENNKLGREKQKEQYDKGTKLRTFQPGDMVYLRQMIKRKRDCQKFRLRWKGPFEVVKRLSDWNYLVKVARNKNIVVNINKMKRCYRKVPPSPTAPTDIPTSASEENGGQEATDEERVTSPIPYNNLANGNSSAPAPPEEINEEREDLTQDPTWEPGRRLETRTTTDDQSDLGQEPRARYWLRNRPADTQADHDVTPPEVVQEQNDNEAIEAEPVTGLADEVERDQIRDVGDRSIQRYNFRPLPGRRLE
jgi:hypothetical protein